MIHRHRNIVNTARSGSYKNIVFQKKTGRWYVQFKVYAESAAEAIALRGRILVFINSLVDAPCTAENDGVSLNDESGGLDASAVPSESGGTDDEQ